MGANILNLGIKNFESTIKQDGITIIDFWASWCGPCRAFAPVFERVADRNPDIRFAKVNTEEEPQLSGALQVMSIPTVMVFRDGIMLFEQPGMLPEKALDELLKQVKALDMDKVRAEMDAQEKSAEAVA